ncbi:Ig-like domain-containing protein [Deltaproteobacteria bacterium TL4]
MRTLFLLMTCLLLSLSLVACGDFQAGSEDQPQSKEFQSTSARISIGFSDEEASMARFVSTAKFKGVTGDISKITLTVKNGTTALVSDKALTQTASEWSATLSSLPVGVALTFEGHATNAGNVEIFNGSTQQTLVESDNNVTLTLVPVDDAITPALPKIIQIANPAKVQISKTETIAIQIGGTSGEKLTYQIAAATSGGSFTPASGEITLTGTTATISFSYTAPATLAKYKHTFTLTNAQNNTVFQDFEMEVIPEIPSTPPAFAAVAQAVTTTKNMAKAITLSAINTSVTSLTYNITTQPLYGIVTVSGATATYTPTTNYVGTDSFAFKVNDEISDSSPATVSITVNRPPNQTPVANAGSAQTVVKGNTVTLNGSASSDPDGDALTYSWSLTTKPSGSTATLSNATTTTPTFVPNEEGSYVATLTVNDGFATSTPATVTITVTDGRPASLSEIVGTWNCPSCIGGSLTVGSSGVIPSVRVVVGSHAGGTGCVASDNAEFSAIQVNTSLFTFTSRYEANYYSVSTQVIANLTGKFINNKLQMSVTYSFTRFDYNYTLCNPTLTMVDSTH